ncbi:YopT-type cysteine protease domain-containing protein [Burkholderia gladioli]|uniref:YopT-type cysteine protease domain-containing protein n=1 Tax=Burkholderia gladioli TaxID=28095 RepID=UPI00164192BA|nr:YopT-type cysteine protease domain-containing protein [Burkholderia gladioli]
MPSYFPKSNPVYNPYTSHPSHDPQSATQHASPSVSGEPSARPNPYGALPPSMRSQRSSTSSRPPRHAPPAHHSQPGINHYPPQSQTAPAVRSRSWISRLCCLSDPAHDTTPPQQAQRPDLSNIQHIGRELAQQRTRDALLPFLGNRYNMGQVADSVGQEIGEGVCYGLSMEWLANRRSGAAGQNADSLAALRSPAALGRAQSVQNNYVSYQQSIQSVSHDPSVRTDMAITEIFRQQGVQVSRATDLFNGESMHALTRAPGDYVVGLIGFGTGHAITVHRPARNERDQRLTVFDSNMGEFKVSRRDEEYFFDAMQARYAVIGERFTHASAYSIP